MYCRRNVILIILICNLRMKQCNTGNTTSVNITAWKSYPFLLDLNFTTGILWKSASANVAFCARLCEDDTRCKSFGYHKQTMTCQGQSNKEYNPNYVSVSVGVTNFFLQGDKFKIESVRASSIFLWYGVPMDPMLVIDGNVNTFFGTETETSGFPYIEAEWTNPISVTNIIVYKRLLEETRFDNVFVYIGMKNETLDFCDVLPGSYSEHIHQFVCSYPIKGNKMILEHRGEKKDTAYPPFGFAFRILEIAEIYLYGFQ